MFNNLIGKNKELGRFLFCERYTLPPVKNAMYIAEGQELKRGAVVDVNGVLVGTNSLIPYAVLEFDCDTRSGGKEASVFIKGEFNFDKLSFADGLSKDDMDNIVYNGSGSGIVIKPYAFDKEFSPQLQLSSNLAPNYTKQAYPANSYVMQDGVLYTNPNAIETAEDWNPAHWTQTTAVEAVGAISEAIPEGASAAIAQIDEKIIKYGSNLLTEDAVSLGTGWSGDLATGLVHSGSSTDPVTFSTPTTNNKAYLVKLTLSSAIQGKLGVSIGNKPLCDVYNGNTNVAVGVISDGGSLKITPLETNVSVTVTNLEFCEVSEEGENELAVLVNNVSGDQMQKNLTGFWNVALDKTSLPDCENASRNVAIGHYALFKLVTGTRNVAIGTFALPWAKYANGNIAIGADTLYNTDSEGNYSPESNVAIGFSAQKVGSSTTRNVSVGNYAAGDAPANSANNVNIGTQAGRYAKTYNVNVGDRAGYYTKGSQNVSVGGGAGSALYITGDNNVSVGYSAGPKNSSASSENVVTMNNTISIGANARATKSDQIMIGSATHTEIVVLGNKKLIFNNDGTVTWEELS